MRLSERTKVKGILVLAVMIAANVALVVGLVMAFLAR
jgi:hypothetical protein